MTSKRMIETLSAAQTPTIDHDGHINNQLIQQWLASYPLAPVHVDCAIAVMLKILDGKCKMGAAEKRVMERLYDAIKSLPGQLLDSSIHQLIASARACPDDGMKSIIYEQRLLAETAISRPVMKGFKAMIRRHGLLDDALDTAEEKP